MRRCRWPPTTEETLVLVPGCDELADIPPHWVVDTELGVATWHSRIGRQLTVKLPPGNLGFSEKLNL